MLKLSSYHVILLSMKKNCTQLDGEKNVCESAHLNPSEYVPAMISKIQNLTKIEQNICFCFVNKRCLVSIYVQSFVTECHLRWVEQIRTKSMLQKYFKIHVRTFGQFFVSWVWKCRQRHRSPGRLQRPCSAVSSLGLPSRTDAGHLTDQPNAVYLIRMHAHFVISRMKQFNIY